MSRQGQSGLDNHNSFSGVIKMEIKWAAGSRFKTDAEVAHKEVERIRKANGGDVDPEAIVQAAKAKRNPLHNEFEWDDKVAAHEYRLHRGRVLLSSIVVIRDDVVSDRPQRVYHHVKKKSEHPEEKPKRVYRTAEQCLQDDDTRAELLGRALKELISFRNRYRDLQELAVVLRGIDQIIENAEV
jgi:hypothetical protein